MKKRTWIIGVGAVLALVGAAAATRNVWTPHGAVAQAPQAVRTVPVDVVIAEKKSAPVFVEALGTVSPIESNAIRSRVDSEIVGVHFRDGATVKKGGLLFTLDSRALEAQVRQADGNVARDQAQLDGAERDVRRYTDLVAKNATPVVNLDNAKTQAETFRANLIADQAALDNLKVQLTYCTIRAQISGRISAAAVKVGNFVRAGDVAPLATINQIAPIYVSFALPQRTLADVRHALGAESALVEALVPGERRSATGQLSMIENAVDSSTGMERAASFSSRAIGPSSAPSRKSFSCPNCRPCSPRPAWCATCSWGRGAPCPTCERARMRDAMCPLAPGAGFIFRWRGKCSIRLTAVT